MIFLTELAKTPFWDITASWYVPSQVCKQAWIGRPIYYQQSLTSVGINAIKTIIFMIIWRTLLDEQFTVSLVFWERAYLKPVSG